MRRWIELALKAGWLGLPVLTVMVFIAVLARRVAPTITIGNLDYFPLVERGVRLSLTSLNAWVDRVHPVGYSWLIRWGLVLGWDAERVGQALSIAGGVSGLLGTFLIAFSVFRDKRLAAVTLVFVAATSQFLYFASVEGNDMLAAGVQVMALGLLMISTLRRQELDRRLVCLSGLVAGLAYLVRYNGMLTAIASLVWLILLSVFERRRSMVTTIALYAVAFLLGSALQWIPSWLATGTPFYNDQGQNVWFHVYGKTDFIREFGQAPAGITLVQVILMNPYLFIEHWWGVFQRFWIAPDLAVLDAPLKLFGQAGLIFMLLAKGPASPKLRGLIGFVVMAHLSALSMMRLDRRFLIVLIPLLATGAVYFFVALIPPRWDLRRTLMPLNVLVLMAGLAWAAHGLLGFADGRPAPDKVVIEASNALHAAGMHSASEVLSTHLRLQDAAARNRDRFTQGYVAAPDLKSVDELVRAMRSHGWRFLIYSQETGPTVYPALTDLLTPQTHPPDLAPIDVPDNQEFVIYRLVDQELKDCAHLDARLENGIRLECYELYASRDVPAGSGQRLGVYLSWRSASQVDASLKVFVHLVNAGGQLVAQHDGVPVQWLAPTDEWTPGRLIVDFHQVLIGANVPPGEYTLQVGLYDQDSGARVKQVDAAGNPMADTIVLTKIRLENP